MRKSTFIFYLIFSVAVFGCFAALAKYDYGFMVMSAGCIMFLVGFVIEGIRSWQNKVDSLRDRTLNVVECGILAGFSFIWFCKVSVYLFLGINTVYLILAIMLTLLTIYKAQQAIAEEKPYTRLTYPKLLLYSSLIIFLVADIYSKLEYEFLALFAVLGLLVSITTLLYVMIMNIRMWLARRDRIDLAVKRNKSYWLLFGYTLLFSYQLMVYYNLTDEVYNKRLPRDYVKLFYDAESGREEPVDGKYKFEIYLEGRNRFVENYYESKK